MEMIKPKITIITPSVRKEGLELVKKALSRQTLPRYLYEWIVQERVGELPTDCVWTLNRDMNTAIKKAQGELIISWQDYTYAKPDALEKFWFYYKQNPKAVISGVGNKYEDSSFKVITWQDPREITTNTFYTCPPQQIEFNFCSIPKAAFYDIGGYDEELDKWFGMDGISIVDRLNLIGGYEFKLDQTNKSYSLEHGRLPDWEEKNAIHGPYMNRQKDYLLKPILNYLLQTPL